MYANGEGRDTKAGFQRYKKTGGRRRKSETPSELKREHVDMKV